MDKTLVDALLIMIRGQAGKEEIQGLVDELLICGDAQYRKIKIRIEKHRRQNESVDENDN